MTDFVCMAYVFMNLIMCEVCKCWQALQLYAYFDRAIARSGEGGTGGHKTSMLAVTGKVQLCLTGSIQIMLASYGSCVVCHAIVAVLAVYMWVKQRAAELVIACTDVQHLWMWVT